MCILFLHTNAHPEPGHYRLILASNRDEYFVRNAQEARQWSDNPIIISGVDLEPGREGGTWLGLGISQTVGRTQGAVRVGALLNVTGEQRCPEASGRGFIVTDYLKNPFISTADYLKQLISGQKVYNAFNFVALEVGENLAQTFHYSNVGNDKMSQYGPIATLGFGNSLPDAPLSKVKAGKARFQEIIDKYEHVSQSAQLNSELIDLLKWDHRHLPDEELSRRAPEAFEYLSSVYVHIPKAGYGTRTHTVILVDWQGQVHYTEHTMRSPINPNHPDWIQHHVAAHL